MIDLHIHSSASDGELAPTALAHAAHRGGLRIIALSDHDTTSGVIELRNASPIPVTLIDAIEISTSLAGAELHILGYAIDPSHPALLEYAAAASDRRRNRMKDMVGRLQELGVRITFDEVLAAAGERVASIGRPHLARALLRAGCVASPTEAFDRFIADGKPAYVPSSLLTPTEALDLIHTANGLAVWAHPPTHLFQSLAPTLAEQGLDGAECLRPRQDLAERSLLLRTALRLGLLVTGGSDWHGPWNGRLGEFSLAYEEVAPFLERCGLRVPTDRSSA